MKPDDMFGVCVRLTGLLIVIYGLYEVWAGLDNLIENGIALAEGDDSDQVSTFSFFMFGIPSLFVGAGMFFLADWIVRLGYKNAAP